MSLTKLSLSGNNLLIPENGKNDNLVYSVQGQKASVEVEHFSRFGDGFHQPIHHTLFKGIVSKEYASLYV